MNPGPHGPEFCDLPSRRVGFCGFQIDSSGAIALVVQIRVNFQPDHYMKYYTGAPAQSARVSVDRDQL